MERSSRCTSGPEGTSHGGACSRRKSRSVTQILARPFPGGGPAGIAWKTGTSAGNRDDWAVGYDRRYVAGVWLGEPTGGALPNQSTLSALPVLARVFGLLDPAPLRPTLPERPAGLALAPQATLALLFPPPKTSLPVGLPVHLRAMGRVRPLRFLIDGRLVPSIAVLRSTSWLPPGPGFYRLTVMDAAGDSLASLLAVGEARPDGDSVVRPVRIVPRGALAPF